jgi:Asp-tRNA(Asn)/Glu-tRNA(Gln) amidotransferase A subunit family amidase
LNDDNLLHLSATEIARKIRLGEVSPVVVVEAHIRRIEAVNPAINAVVTPLFEQARAEAQAAQDHLAQHGTDDLPPLFGVPITIKDCWAVQDARFTGGSWYMRDHIAPDDAESVGLLRAAGAIILGKTNLPDMCWSGESVNPVFGLTNNPHNPKYSVGGSSGGEGAIIAAGGSPLGLGSDIAGSVRIPAAMSGCVALKPTSGRVPSGDHIPSISDPIGHWNTAGPLARRVEDLALAMQVLSRTSFGDYTQVSLQGRACRVFIQNGLIPVRRDVVKTVEMAAGTLAAAGMATNRDDKLPLLRAAFAYLALMRRYGNGDFKRALGGGKPYNLFTEIGRTLRGKGRISARVLWFTEGIGLLGLAAKLLGYESFDKLEQYKQQTLDAMGEGGVILCPLLITAPPKHGWIWTLVAQPPYTFMFNALGFPCAVVPVGYNDMGLPMAVQVVARPGEDEVALAVAAELERVHGGWQMAQM